MEVEISRKKRIIMVFDIHEYFINPYEAIFKLACVVGQPVGDLYHICLYSVVLYMQLDYRIHILRMTVRTKVHVLYKYIQLHHGSFTSSLFEV